MVWFDLAELLHMSVARAKSEVSLEERNHWIARAIIKAEKEESE